jgi:CRP/FNR family cyclic AMP-dependent transcriptional regulator
MNFGAIMTRPASLAGAARQDRDGSTSRGLKVLSDADQSGATNPSQTALLVNHFLFKDLGTEIHERLRSLVRTRRVARGATIFSKGDPGTALFAVASGSVRVTALSPHGKNAVFNLIHEGEIFGEIALLDGKPRTADAVAFADCSLMVIERRDFMPLLRDHPELTLRLLEVLCARLRRTTEQVEDILFLDLKSRLLKTLLRLSETEGGEITISQDHLSQMVGMSREMINKQLQVWVKSGWIGLARRRIKIIDPEALGQLLAEEEASGWASPTR